MHYSKRRSSVPGTMYGTKVVHRAAKWDDEGRVSPLCANPPRALSRHQRWTNRDEAVTCPRCRAAIKELKEAFRESLPEGS